eukprot:CAMPEP_0113546614 /NCGR_PEP_ID=MMETSP0015_2-20120614/11901_1 /TAXON_ID=2838 /ORGANISM="Odontella" /LENGTH=319 /DNA_ID=CAMNT_0000447083 /DNA_START=36 /DNA_END=995 /DNA_ORIENTATION=+ /assembly_acc=CAM_ASM_000160
MTVPRSAAAALLLLASRADAFAPGASSTGRAFRRASGPLSVIDPTHVTDLLRSAPSFTLADGSEFGGALTELESAIGAASASADAAAVAASDLSAAASTAVEAVQAVSASDAATSAAAAIGEPAYSKWSYYTTLGLYIMSFPGIWSQVTRSTKAKIKRKTYVSDGENSNVSGSKDMRQQAGEIMAYMKANNYEVEEAGETITFKGLVQRSTSQAFFLVFCTAIGMASLALVLQIQFNDLVLPLIGKPNWFYLVLLGPYAGIYYWGSGDRTDEIKVKLATNDDESLNEVTVEGNDDELDRMWRALELREKGMVRVEGLLQ